jgi:AraC family transcriptional regulator
MTLKQGSEPVPDLVSPHLYTERLSVRRAKELIANHLSERLSVARIAEACALSRSHFSRAFKQSTGMAPHAWLLQMRIEKAKEMLASGQYCLSHIALDCGFADQAHFTRVFSRWEGTTPSAWCRMRP